MTRANLFGFCSDFFCICQNKAVPLHAELCNMVILAIETSTKVCSAALVADGQIVSFQMDKESGNHARQLPLFITQLLDDAKQQNLTIDAVALSDGPGSYTGLRIGTSTAKGLCYGLNVPLVPIKTTDVLCLSVIAEQQLPDECYLMPMIDAHRMEVYTGIYLLRKGAASKTNNNQPVKLIGEIEARIIDGNTKLPDDHPLFFFGDGAAKCRELLEKDDVHFVPEVMPNAVYMAALAGIIVANGIACTEPNEIAYHEPFYLKDFVAAKSHVKGLE